MICVKQAGGANSVITTCISTSQRMCLKMVTSSEKKKKEKEEEKEKEKQAELGM